MSSSIDRKRIYEMLCSYMEGSVQYFLDYAQCFSELEKCQATYGSGVVQPLLRNYNDDGGRNVLDIRDKEGNIHECRVLFYPFEKRGSQERFGVFNFSRRELVIYLPFRLNEYRVPEWEVSVRSVVDVAVHELTHFVTTENKRLSVQGLRSRDMHTTYYMGKHYEFRCLKSDVMRKLGTAVMCLLYYLHFSERNSYATGSREFMEPYIKRIEDSYRYVKEELPREVSQSELNYYYGEVKRIFDNGNEYGMFIPATYGKMVNFADRNYRKLLMKLRRNQDRLY